MAKRRRPGCFSFTMAAAKVGRMFRPFGDKPVRDLAPEDVAKLRDVAEGWFVEFKREPCKPRDYAKAVSAFANDRGGYLIIGIVQDMETRKPASAPGVDAKDAASLLDSARDAISQNLSPCPRFDLTFVAGPVDAIGLEAGRALLVIEVPQSENTPHVHSSGRIYRRQADRSTPVEVTNRAELDELYRRHSRLMKAIEKALSAGFDAEWSTAFEQPWVHCALVPSSSNPAKPKVLDFAQVHADMTSKDVGGISLPNVYPSALGYVARNHSEQALRTGPATTLEYAHNGSLYFTLPLGLASADADPHKVLKSSDNVLSFVKALREGGMHNAEIIDGTALCAALFGLHIRARALLRLAGMSGPYLVRLQCKNVFRRVPYFASSAYVDWCSRSGVPLIHRSAFSIPSARGWDRMEAIENEYAISGLSGMLLLALGVPREIVGEVVEQTWTATTNGGSR